MASIMNAQLKGYKQFMGHEGYGFNANLYLNNKKVAWCVDSGDGGMMSVDFVSKEARLETEKIIEAYYQKYPKRIGCDGMICDFVEELISLLQIEKWYKKVSKQGCPVVVDISYNGRMTDILDYNFDKQDLMTCYQGWDDKTEAAMKKKYQPVEYKVYKSLEDFDIQ